MKRKRQNTTTAAVLTVHHAGKMTARERRTIANWLVRQAAFLLKEGGNYSPRFRARYLYATR